MDAVLRLPGTLIITLVALVGAYSLGKAHAHAHGKLNKAEGTVEGKAEGKGGSEDFDALTEDKGSGSDDEVKEEKARKESKGVVRGKQKSKTAKTKPKGERQEVMCDDWEWPIYTIDRKGVRRRATPEKTREPNLVPFKVTYRRRQDIPDEVMVKLLSMSLIQFAKICLHKHPEKFVSEEPEIDGRDLFIALNSLKESYQSMQNPEDDAMLDKYHLKHLIRFLETEYEDTIPQVERTKRRKTVRWDQLWTFLHKDEIVYYTCSMTGRKLQGIVWFAEYTVVLSQGDGNRENCFIVEVKCFDYNGTKYKPGTVKIIIEEFHCESSFESIGICPFTLLEQSEVKQLEAMFLQNGKKFYHIVSRGSFYMQYEGPCLQNVQESFRGRQQLNKEKADGRVMVDLLSLARTSSGYPLKNAQPWAGKGRHRRCGDTDVPSDEDLMLAPAVVYGFSFSIKKWGGFDVCGLSEIQFMDRAFDDDLVLSDPSTKKMLLASVSEYLSNPNDATSNQSLPTLDPISSKGEGCILLCYGPPGTGKTLTAECIAEKLKRPLWSISVFELGTTPKDLEKGLLQILDTATHWGAVLLLDEADVYMEKRILNGDPTRAAMTSIFLRQIEYYRGVLFLTTNRVASFDDAFCSRISMFLRFQRLAGDQFMAVWRNLLARAGIENPDLTPFMATETLLNGREIRNTIRIAQTWAKSSGEKLTTDHVLQVVKMVTEFCQDMEGAIKDECNDRRDITRALERVRSTKDRNGNSAECNGNFMQAASPKEC